MDALPDDLKAELAALRAPMLKKRLWVITWTNLGAIDDTFFTILPAHYRWQLDLEERGVLFGSGGLFLPSGEPSMNGMTIVRAASAEDVEAVVATEPFVQKKMRTYTIRGWDLNEGSITVRVNLGTGKFFLD